MAQKLDPITNFQLKARRVLKGHQGKVLALDWCCDKRHLASTSQVYHLNHSKYIIHSIRIYIFIVVKDGKLIIWEAFTTNKAS